MHALFFADIEGVFALPLCLAPLPAAAPELAAIAVSKLESVLREVELTGAADYLSQHALPPRHQRGTPEPATAAAAAAGATPGTASPRQPSAEPMDQDGSQAEPAPAGPGHQRQATDAVRDLDRWVAARTLVVCCLLVQPLPLLLQLCG